MDLQVTGGCLMPCRALATISTIEGCPLNLHCFHGGINAPLCNHTICVACLQHMQVP